MKNSSLVILEVPLNFSLIRLPILLTTILIIIRVQNPENFASVLEMYRSGKFHIPDGGRGWFVE